MEKRKTVEADILRGIIILLAAILLAGMPLSVSAQSEFVNTPDMIRERGVLKVGTAGDYRPMSYKDPETGAYEGFDAELAEDLAAALGVQLEYVETSWPTLMEDTLAGKFDLAICGITITDARKEQALMSDGYLGNGKTILIRAEDADLYTSLDDINKPWVRVMENPGGLNEKFARENLPEADLTIHPVNQEIPGLIAEGAADVMITEIMEAGFYVGQDARLAAPLITRPFTKGQLGVMMPKGSEELLDFVNEFLKEEKSTGRIAELAEQYIYRYVLSEYETLADDGVILSSDSSDFVLLSEAVPDAILEIRYYSTYNFVGDRIDGYEEPLAMLTKEAAAALKEVSDELIEEGYRLKIYDAYRPQMAVTHFVRWAQDTDDTRMKSYFYPELEKDVLFPLGYIDAHSGHSRGSTVDLTLFDMTTEKEVDMGGTFDYFGELSHPDYTGITEEQYANRMILREAMMAHGFRPLPEEWWHFTLENEPWPDRYFTFPVNSESVAAYE